MVAVPDDPGADPEMEGPSEEQEEEEAADS